MDKSPKNHSNQKQPAGSSLIDGLRSVFSKRARSTRLLDNTCLIFLVIAISVSLYYRPGNHDPLSRLNLLEQIAVFSVCLFLWIAYRFHTHHCERLRERDSVDLDAEFMTSEKWTLALVTITLPLGLSLVSEVFADGGILAVYKAHAEIAPPGLSPQIAQIAFHFSQSVFFVMVTLEIAYLYDFDLPEWRSLITASIVLNLIGFTSFLLIGSPGPDKQYRSLTIIIIALSGVVSLISSFDTILYARAAKRIARRAER